MFPTSGNVGNRNAKGSLAGRGAYKRPAALSAEYLRKRARAAAGTSASSRVKPKRVKKLKLKTFKFRRYFLSGLDLSWARKAAVLHPWEDQWTVDALMKKLEAGNGGMSFDTYHNKGQNFDRLQNVWPTLHNASWQNFNEILLFSNVFQVFQ